MKYWIEDEDDSPQRFPLKKLMNLIIKELDNEGYELWLVRGWGYGVTINKWNELLDIKDKIMVDPEVFEKIGEGTEEWFYDVNAEIITNETKIRFGLFDSTALYIDAPLEIASSIIKSFKMVRKA